MAETTFSAIRISLASPEQIKSWSYGEVTKPETINYRNQKPEKDGLFDERIFGPTKDFECFCGKYKRIRYRGVICDRCGVEVTRAKVRRERMGHIQLAAPVAHIWFVKGTPSWLGLLMDMSPRNLERIVYAAQYVIVSVDEKAKDDLLQNLQREEDEELSQVRREMEAAVQTIQGQMDQDLAEIQQRREALLAPIETRLAEERQALQTELATVQGQLDALEGTVAEEEISLHDRSIVAAGATVGQEHRDALQAASEELLAEAEERARSARQQVAAQFEAETEQKTQATSPQVSRVQKEYGARLDEARQRWDDKRGDIEELRPLRPLTEARYRDLRDQYHDLFVAGTGADALLEILLQTDLQKLRDELLLEASSSSGQRAKKAAKRLRVVEAFRKSGNKPEWMILAVLPVLPPDLRPMVQLDGGRFATSDLNDLYRRVINRNNRLKRLMELGAPEIIIRNEKRMLQEAVDALIDNGRRGRALTGSHNHRLKSLSDMLRGKQGRFRQNLLGKRVDYSGRSVIVVGPDLKLHQCGLPKRMALELFKPFVMHRLVLHGHVPNVKSAKRMVDRVRPEVWDVLEEVIKERPVLLNRAPTLHRLGIQAFEPTLVEGSAIQIHPLVCAAFNADFDGDQMAVHVPVGRRAVQEARKYMLSTYNMLLPSSGEPVVAPTLDIVVGCYYLTLAAPGAKGEGSSFANLDDARLAYELGLVDLRASIEVRQGKDGQPSQTTVGRILFNEVLPEGVAFRNSVVDKKVLKEIVTECYRLLDNDSTSAVLDAIKRLGFHYATRSGLTIALNDVVVPAEKHGLLEEADSRIAKIQRDFQRGLITDQEMEEQTITIWQEINRRMEEIISGSLQSYGNLYLMAGSGAKGNIGQIKQMGGMRGLMADPKGKILPLPIRSSFREGLTVLEYFISTHGARKGLADTALRTADSGYLTRRLIDVSQDIIAGEADCGTMEGTWMEDSPDRAVLGNLAERIAGRLAARPIAHPETGELLVDRNEEIDEEKARAIQAMGITRVYVRSPLNCQAPRGICCNCYGRSLARGRLVQPGEAVGIIAAQSIGESGTQLTMRTFHTGGVAGLDITSGLPRVEELFEARTPKITAPLAELDGVVEVREGSDGRRIRLTSSETVSEEYLLPEGYEPVVRSSDWVEVGAELARPASSNGDNEDSLLPANRPLQANIAGQVAIEGNTLTLLREEREERNYIVPANARLLIEPGQRVDAGSALTEGPLNPQDVLRIKGKDAVQSYLVDEVQKVYRSQGVVIHDKHIEVIVRQMLRRLRIETSGDTEFLQGDLVDRFAWEVANAKVLAEGGEPATAQPVLLGVTKASLNTDSFLAAASFQETTRVLTEAALFGKVDRLLGLKENVIIGRLIPARIGTDEWEALAALADASSDEEEDADLLPLNAERLFQELMRNDDDEAEGLSDTLADPEEDEEPDFSVEGPSEDSSLDGEEG